MNRHLLVSACTLPLLLLASCTKDINNKDAIRAAVIDHLTSRQGQIGLDVKQMDIEVGSMSFQKDQASAVISFRAKAGGDPMQIPYSFERKGDKWAVKGRMESGPGSGHGAGAPLPTGDDKPAATLPPGHPQTGGAPKAAGPLPAGHPPVGAPSK